MGGAIGGWTGRRLAGGRGQEAAEGGWAVGGRGRRREQTCLEPRLEEKRRETDRRGD